jgi:hypothetical protein
MYDRLYVPLSTMHAHASGLVLLRHVAPDDRPVVRPLRTWPARSALHAVDASVALLARALLPGGHPAAPVVDAYADAHMTSTAAPVAVMGVTGLAAKD